MIADIDRKYQISYMDRYEIIVAIDKKIKKKYMQIGNVPVLKDFKGPI